MIKKGLIPYIERNLAKGFSHKHIIDAFVKRGYSRNDVEDTFDFLRHHKKHSKRKIHQKFTKDAVIFAVVLANVAVVALLWNFYGGSKPNASDSCIFEGLLACKNFSVRSDEILISISNSIGYKVNNAIMVVEQCGNSARANSFQNGTVQTFRIICGQQLKGPKYSGNIRLDYTSEDTIYSVYGHLSGKVE